MSYRLRTLALLMAALAPGIVLSGCGGVARRATDGPAGGILKIKNCGVLSNPPPSEAEVPFHGVEEAQEFGIRNALGELAVFWNVNWLPDTS